MAHLSQDLLHLQDKDARSKAYIRDPEPTQATRKRLQLSHENEIAELREELGDLLEGIADLQEASRELCEENDALYETNEEFFVENEQVRGQRDEAQDALSVENSLAAIGRAQEAHDLTRSVESQGKSLIRRMITLTRSMSSYALFRSLWQSASSTSESESAPRDGKGKQKAQEQLQERLPRSS